MRRRRRRALRPGPGESSWRGTRRGETLKRKNAWNMRSVELIDSIKRKIAGASIRSIPHIG